LIFRRLRRCAASALAADMADSSKPKKYRGQTVWRQPDGAPLSCVEKIKVLNQNLDEIRQLAQDAFEDAVLMGCDEKQIRDVLAETVKDLVNPYRKP
jgi:hypothetical protein